MQNRIRTITLAGFSIGVLTLTVTPAAAQTAAQDETYQLVQVAGGALPALIEEEDGCREEVLAGTLTLAADGRWTLTTEREVCGEDIEEDEEQEDGTYEADADAIRFLDDDDEDDDDDDDTDTDLDLDDLATGTRTATELTVRLDDQETVLGFRR